MGGDGEAIMLGHLLAPISGERAAQCLRPRAHVAAQRTDHGGAVLARGLGEHRKARTPLYEHRQVRVVGTAE